MNPALRKLIQVGIVSSVNAAAGSARVAFTERDSLVSNELQICKRAWPVKPGDEVLCLFLPTGNADGFIVDSYYTEDDPPPGGA